LQSVLLQHQTRVLRLTVETVHWLIFVRLPQFTCCIRTLIENGPDGLV
jgi:hypothetical protein